MLLQRYQCISTDFLGNYIARCVMEVRKVGHLVFVLIPTFKYLMIGIIYLYAVLECFINAFVYM